MTGRALFDLCTLADPLQSREQLPLLRMVDRSIIARSSCPVNYAITCTGGIGAQSRAIVSQKRLVSVKFPSQLGALRRLRNRSGGSRSLVARQGTIRYTVPSNDTIYSSPRASSPNDTTLLIVPNDAV